MPSLFETAFTLPPEPLPAPPSAFAERLCEARHPLALLPVRLETRFFSIGADQELRIRIYPDKIHIAAHEAALTADEYDWGTHYWTQDWRAGSDRVARNAAWSQITDRFGTPRATWIARALQPANLTERPAQTIAADAGLVPAPQFPTLESLGGAKGASWSEAPKPALLPERWIAVLHSNGTPAIVAESKPVAPDLAVGPNPDTSDAPSPTEGQPAIDDAMRWMIDFKTAEDVGMALRVPVPKAVLDAGLDLLVVFGTSGARDPEAIAGAFGDLLDAHRFDDGLAFLEVGTPTNPVSELGQSSSVSALSFAMAVEAAASGDAASNAAAVSASFGFGSGALAAGINTAPGADAHHRDDQIAMATVLWQATWGNYLVNLIGLDGTGLTADVLDWAREHFLANVQALGPLPAIRCGKQPYGVLPTTSLDLWHPESSSGTRDAWLHQFLIKLRDKVWRPALPNAPRTGRTGGDRLDEDLAETMSVDALSAGYNTRGLYGPRFVENLHAFLGEDIRSTGFLDAEDRITAPLPTLLDLPVAGRLAHALYAELAWRVKAPLVPTAGDDWLDRLRARRAVDLLAPATAPPPGAAPPSLAELLIQYSLDREIAIAAAHLAAQAPGTDLAQMLRDSELIVSGDPTGAGLRDLLQRKIAAVTGDKTIAEFIDNGADNAPAARQVHTLRASLDALAKLAPATLDVLLRATLDLSSYRLDAWISSLATARLGAMRKSAPTGLLVGGYGWVENLKPAPPDLWQPVAPPAGVTGDIYTSNDTGFIHAPSLTHASAAALLRNTQLSATGVAEADGPFAIQLSSRRVREAERLAQGIRNGQPLGALLGYRLERSLSILGLDRFIAPLRTVAPLVAGKLENAAQPVAAIAANTVVDGLALRQIWTDTPARVNDAISQAGADAAALARVTREIDDLNNIVDGLGDAFTAEIAYQMARGNSTRGAATLDALGSGGAPPAQFESARFPRTGIALTHRLVWLLGEEGPGHVPWPGQSPRALMTPDLERWAAGIFGDPSSYHLSVEQLGSDGSVSATRNLTLGDVRVAALDIVFGVQSGTSADAGKIGPALEGLLLDAACSGTGALDRQLPLRLASPANAATALLGLDDALELASLARALLGKVRVLIPEDINPPARVASLTIDVQALEERARAARATLSSTINTMQASLDASDAPIADHAAKARVALGQFGIASNAPGAAVTSDAGQLAVQTEAQARLARADAILAALPIDPLARASALGKAAKTLFGSDFLAPPHFSIGTAAADELVNASAGCTAQGADLPATAEWLLRAARVRAPLAATSALLHTQETLTGGGGVALSMAQLPYDASEMWVGLPGSGTISVAPGKVSLVMQVSGAFAPAAPLAGLMIDEWTELVPGTSETTAITFQYGLPNNVAPQAILLAVPPDPNADWTLGTLHRVLVETLDLAKLRAIDPSLLGAASQYLPAIAPAFNANGDTPSADLGALTL